VAKEAPLPRPSAPTLFLVSRCLLLRPILEAVRATRLPSAHPSSPPFRGDALLRS
jgi:hypothetical protein